MPHSTVIYYDRAGFKCTCEHSQTSSDSCPECQPSYTVRQSDRSRLRILGQSGNQPYRNKIPIRPARPIVRTKVSQRGSGSRRQVVLSGFPVDVFHPEPFNAYPIPSVGCVPRMVEYFVQVWAPQQGRPFAVEGHQNPYLSLFFPFALQHAELFEAVVALTRTCWLLAQSMPCKTDAALVYHRNNAMSGLHRRLVSPKTFSDDITVLSLAALTTINYMLGETKDAASHIYIMRQIVERRSMTDDSSSWKSFIKLLISAYEAMWSFVQSGSIQRIETTSSRRMTPNDKLPSYPSHPFSPDLCDMLSKLPKGITDLTVAGVLSTLMVQILVQLSAVVDQVVLVQEEREEVPAELENVLQDTMADLQRLVNLKTISIEHLFCQGVMVYSWTLRNQKGLGTTYSSTLHSICDEYSVYKPTSTGIQHECFIWVSVVLATALDQSTDPVTEKNDIWDSIFDQFQQTRSWPLLERILRTFLWDNTSAMRWKASWKAAMNRYQLSCHLPRV